MNLLETATALGVSGFLHPVELEKLAELAINREVLEIGSFMGLSAWGMAITAKSLLCVDTFRANSAGQQQMPYFTTYEAFQKATVRYRNVTAFLGTSEEAARAIHDRFGMIFLDAMHTYEDVRDDIQRWWPRLNPGGWMVFHDYGHADFPGVKRAVDEIFGPQTNVLVTLMWMAKPL